jgi:hypothetical protein
LHLAELKTSFAKFKRSHCEGLIYRGWWLAGGAITRFHRDVLPSPLPCWRSIPS